MRWRHTFGMRAAMTWSRWGLRREREGGGFDTPGRRLPSLRRRLQRCLVCDHHHHLRIELLLDVAATLGMWLLQIACCSVAAARHGRGARCAPKRRPAGRPAVSSYSDRSARFIALVTRARHMRLASLVLLLTSACAQGARLKPVLPLLARPSDIIELLLGLLGPCSCCQPRVLTGRSPAAFTGPS